MAQGGRSAYARAGPHFRRGLDINFHAILAATVAATLAAATPGAADDLQTFEITLKGHAFSPSEIHVPSGKPFLVLVKNAGGQADEFEMLIPSVEHGVGVSSQTQFRMRPLRPGRFPFFGENNPDNEKGAINSG